MQILKSAVTALLLMLPLYADPKTPRPAPEFVLNMPQGGQKLLSQYKGKVVLVEFLFTTCPHCQEASRMMTRLQAEYGPKGFQALGVGFNDMAKMLVPDFVRDYKVSYPVGFSTREPVQDFLQIPREESLHVPQLVFIDRAGVIRHQSLPRGDSETAVEPFVRKTVEKLLAEPAAKARTSKATKKAS